MAVPESRRAFLRQALTLAAAGAALTRLRAVGATDAPMLRVQRLAWAGIRLQLGESCVFLDPLVSTNVWEGALADPLVRLDDAHGDRWVLVSHRHPDHCDPVAIRQALGDRGTLLHPEHGGACAAHGVKLRAAATYEPQLLGDCTATAVPAVDGYGDTQVSWIVSAGGRRIIHCGDTLWHGGWWHIGRQFGPFDAAFLPINGARFRWRQPVSDVPAVMTADQAVAAAVVLGARRLVPIHYGVRGADGYAEDPRAEEALLEHAARRNVTVRILEPGAWLDWNA
jgi:L-ascorbate metabolism protein UlaG (beta-lactamase superfamily)